MIVIISVIVINDKGNNSDKDNSSNMEVTYEKPIAIIIVIT